MTTPNAAAPGTADGESFRRIWSLAWPTVVYSVLELSLGAADFLMVRGLGRDASAAIGLNRQITFLVEAAALAVSTGVIALVSQGMGAGDRRQVDGAVRQSLRLVVLLGAPVTLLGYAASGPLLTLMQASPETLAHGAPYLRIYFLGTVFLWANLVAAAVFRGAGDPRTPLKLVSVVSVLNVALNYVFIAGVGPVPAYGVAGAAMGTVGARALGTAAYLVLLGRGAGGVRLRLRPWWDLDRAVIRRLLRVGAWPALAGVLRNGARVVFVGMLGAGVSGAALHAAVGVGLQVRLVAVLPALAFQVAAATLVGQAVGAGDPDRAEALGNRSVVLLAAIMAAVTGVTIVAAGPLASLFLVDPEVAALGATVIRWFAVAQLFSSLSIGTQGALTGAGWTRPILGYTVVTQWGVLLSLTLALFVVLGWDPEGALVAWVVAPVLQLVLMQRLFRRGGWRDRRA
ncbi:MAG: MATE family efflux transporter [Acidobacteria bacterium]|nr:MATE family efflux transporter [Acidobacteriota bacterium]